MQTYSKTENKNNKHNSAKGIRTPNICRSRCVSNYTTADWYYFLLLVQMVSNKPSHSSCKKNNKKQQKTNKHQRKKNNKTNITPRRGFEPLSSAWSRDVTINTTADCIFCWLQKHCNEAMLSHTNNNKIKNNSVVQMTQKWKAIEYWKAGSMCEAFVL